MKRRLALLALAAFEVAAPVPAAACLAPLPGETAPTPPTPEENARSIVGWSDAIVYGILTRGTEDGRTGRFRIIHVYKGDATPGATVAVKPSWGFDAPPCAGLLGAPPPTARGEYGVIAWSGEPELNWIDDRRLEVMFAHGLIQRARRPEK